MPPFISSSQLNMIHALPRSAICEMSVCDWTIASGLRQIRKTMDAKSQLKMSVALRRWLTSSWEDTSDKICLHVIA